MSPWKSAIRQGWLIPAVIAIQIGWTGAARPDDPDPKPRPAASPKSFRTGGPATPVQKSFTLEMRDKPWVSVLGWLADQSGLAVSTNVKPNGTFSFVAPKDPSRVYTLAQVIDILNDSLALQKLLLVRREGSFAVLPADEKIDPALVPRVQPQDLDQRGNTELVSVVIPLTALAAEDVAAEVKKMLGPFGDVLALNRANQLLLQDTAGNVKRICRTISDIDIDNREPTSRDIHAYACKYIKAADAARILGNLLGGLRPVRSASQGTSSSSTFTRGQTAPRPEMPGLPPPRQHALAVDERTNMVLLRGPAGMLTQADAILNKLDVPAKEPVPATQLMLRSYTVPAGYAQPVARMLQEIHKSDSAIRITAVGDSSLLVFAPPDNHLDIARQILNLQAESNPSESKPQDKQKPAGKPTGAAGDSSPGRGELYDIYLKGTPVVENRPAVAGVRFDGIESFADGKFWRFHKENNPADVRLVAPAAVVMIRIRSSSGPSGGGPGSGGFRGLALEQLFDQLTAGKDVWVRADITDEARQRLFDRLAERAGITDGRITRQQFSQFAAERTGRGFPGQTAGSGTTGGFGPARGNPIGEKLDTILEELRKLEKQMGDQDKSKPRVEDPKKR